MGDLIDRQTAIDAFRDTVDLMPECYARDIIAELPSAQLNNSNQELKKSNDCISRQAAIAEFSCCELTPDGGIDANYAIDFLEHLPSAKPEVRPIDYQDCSNAMLKMWMDNVVTDGEYNRIMDKLNAHWGKKDE